MFIQTEATPNPATLKFIPGRVVLDSGTMEFTSRDAAARSPLAERLFSVPSAGSDEDTDERDEFFNDEDAETVATIKDLIETRVRPAVANDGGDITFRGFKDGIVYLNMKGSCAGCPSSTATLQHGIQNLLRHFVPDVVEVRPV
jgi:Fe-S cluster biogenesis protein NfuA